MTGLVRPAVTGAHNYTSAARALGGEGVVREHVTKLYCSWIRGVITVAWWVTV